MKRISCVILTLLVVSCLLSVVPFEADAAGTLTLEQLQETYPNGYYWNHKVDTYYKCVTYLDKNLYETSEKERFAEEVTSTPCSNHDEQYIGQCVGGYDCNYFDGGMQCWGFARKLAYDAYGSRINTWYTHNSILDIKPGDVVFFKGEGADPVNGHWVFVTGVSNTTITVGEANLDNDPCRIRWGHKYDLSRADKVEVYSAPWELESEHIHNYNTFEFYWAEHPHYNCYSCACGAIDANYSERVYLSTCEQCRAETSANLSWTENEGKHSVGSTNAVLAGIGNMSGADISIVSKVGIYLYDYKGTQLVYKTEEVSFDKYSYFEIWYNVNDELGYTLSAGTPYQFKFIAIIGDKTYDSPLYTFTTTGTHSHKFDSGKVTANPTCGKEGTRVYTCTTCGDTKTESIAKLTSHSYNSGVVTKQPTCKEAGVKTYTCAVCGGTKTESIAKLTTHSYDNGTVTKAATCKEEGIKTYACTVCGGTKTESIAKLTTHSYDSGTVTKAATCKEEGIKTYTCTVCGTIKTESISKMTSHSYNGVETKVPTCKEMGVKTYTCAVCGESYTEEIAKLTTHSYENGTCAVCGHSDPDYVPPAEPTEPTEPIAPTEPEVTEPTKPVAPEGEREESGFFGVIAAFFEAIFRILFFFLYL